MKKIFCFISICLVISSMIFADDLPSVRYVNSKDGLNYRDSPSFSGKKLGTLLHGSRIVVHERTSDKETIDGITDYWYRCSGGISGGGGGFYWVFGGYLSKTMPADTEPFLGYWNTDRGTREYWSFRPDHTVSSGRKETGIGWIGTWTLSGDKITIERRPIEAYHKVEIEVVEIIIRIIDRDKISLHFSDGNDEYLTRNNGLL